ncbi:MAG: futalosine hydrolase [Planctomycetes bacterium]|nr:futalosine hydrolase [Planctomycetota bacterium]
MTAPRRRALLLIPTPREAELLLGDAGRGLGAPRLATFAGRSLRVALTGWGLAAAGASSGRWIAELHPDLVVLAGIAGTLERERLPVGALLVASRVACDGLGAGVDDRVVPLREPPLPASLVPAFAPSLAGDGALPLAPLLAPLDASRAGARTGALLSVAAAAGSRSQAEARRARHPEALAEEMEGYAVALAAHLAAVPLTILRGVSNEAGDRDHASWQIEPALAACRRALEQLFEALPR